MQKSFWNDVCEAACGEPILSVVINKGSYAFGRKSRKIPSEKLGVVLTAADAAPLLDYAYDDGFGVQDCHDIYAWTENLVLYVHEYDGATSVESVPRHPASALLRGGAQ